MLGGSSALVSFTFSMATLTKAKTIRPQNKGKPAFQCMGAKRAIPAMVGSTMVAAELPMPLIPWARARLRL